MQEKSYFALALPHGWWLFGLDLALVDDIDMCQCRYGHVCRMPLTRLPEKVLCGQVKGRGVVGRPRKMWKSVLVSETAGVRQQKTVPDFPR